MYRTQINLLILTTFLMVQIIQISSKIRLPEPKKEYDQYLEECYKELDIEKAKFTAADRSKRRCLSKCMATKIGYMKDDGTIIMDVFNKVFNAENDKDNEEILKKCAEINDAKDICIKSIYIDSCIFKNTEFSNTPTEKVMKCTTECMNEMNIQSIPDSSEETDDKHKCFSKCVAEKCNWIDKDNVINVKLLIEDTNMKNVTLVNKCFEISGEEICERMHKIEKCLDKLND